MGATLDAVGRMDTDDEQDCRLVLNQVGALLEISRLHLDREDRFIHAAMEARRPGSSTSTMKEHVNHTHAFTRLDGLINEVQAADGPARAGAANRLYQSLALFVGENLAHMHEEETGNAAVLWADYDDDELRALEGAIVAASTPEQKTMVMRWMIPALNPRERALLLGGLRRGVPPEAFNGTLEMLKPHLSEREWHKLVTALAP
jgi:hypothetical protein